MTPKSVRTLAAAVVLAAEASLVVGAARADVSQTPLTTACPAAFERLSIPSLEAKGP